MADNEKKLTIEQQEMVENIRRAGEGRDVNGVRQLEDKIEMSLGDISLNTASFRLAFDGGNVKLAPKMALREFFRRG